MHSGRVRIIFLMALAMLTRGASFTDVLIAGQRMAVRFGPHPKGETFTVETIDRQGRLTTSSSILYFDGKQRGLRGVWCSGTQISRRVDSQTVEILQVCSNGDWTRFVRRVAAGRDEQVLEITEQQGSGRIVQRIVTEKR